MKDRVILTGFIPNELISNYYNAADIYLLPTLRAEGLPFVLIEAMSFGLPIIASKMGGIPDVVKNGKEGLLINPGDINDMASKILILLKDRILREKLGARARSKVLNELSANKMVDKTLTILKSISQNKAFVGEAKH